MDLDLKSKSDWVEMFPFGVSIGADEMRPVMIFKDKGQRWVLPVWLSPLDAGIAVSQSNTQVEFSPHGLSKRIFDALGVSLERCLFSDVKGAHQYVDLQFSGSRKIKKFEVRADQAISFCIQMKAKFFAKVDYIEKSRVLDAEVQSLPPVIDKSNANRHPYLN